MVSVLFELVKTCFLVLAQSFWQIYGVGKGQKIPGIPCVYLFPRHQRGVRFLQRRIAPRSRAGGEKIICRCKQHWTRILGGAQCHTCRLADACKVDGLRIECLAVEISKGSQNHVSVSFIQIKLQLVIDGRSQQNLRSRHLQLGREYKVVRKEAIVSDVDLQVSHGQHVCRQCLFVDVLCALRSLRRLVSEVKLLVSAQRVFYSTCGSIPVVCAICAHLVAIEEILRRVAALPGASTEIPVDLTSREGGKVVTPSKPHPPQQGCTDISIIASSATSRSCARRRSNGLPCKLSWQAELVGLLPSWLR